MHAGELLRSYCQQHRIQLQSHSLFGGGSLLKHDAIKAAAEAATVAVGAIAAQAGSSDVVDNTADARTTITPAQVSNVISTLCLRVCVCACVCVCVYGCG